MTYTQLAVAGVVVAVIADLTVLRTRLLRRWSFWAAYAIVLFFQLLTNGWLTGREIVRYDGRSILGDEHPRLLGAYRVAYAPVEDLLFGFALALWTLGWWSWLGARQARPAWERAESPTRKRVLSGTRTRRSRTR